MAVVFNFGGRDFTESAIIVPKSDWIYFADAIVEILSVGNIPGEVYTRVELMSLDSTQISRETIKVVIAAYKKIYVYKAAKRGPLSGLYASEAVNAVSDVMHNFDWEARRVLLAMLHYLGNDTLYHITARIFASLLTGLSRIDVMKALAMENHTSFDKHQIKKLNEIVYGNID